MYGLFSATPMILLSFNNPFYIDRLQKNQPLARSCLNTCRNLRILHEEETVESLIDSIENFKGNMDDLDDKIFNHIDKDKEVTTLFDDRLFRLCFLNGLNKVASQLLNSFPSDHHVYSVIGNSSKPLLFENFTVNEDY